MTILTATNGGLMMGLLLGIFFCIIIIWGIFNAVKIAIHPRENQIRRNYIIGSIVGIVVLYFVAYTSYTEYNLLYNYIWVNGKLIDRCYGKGAGPGPSYEFEYYVDGKRYTNCNSAGDMKGIKFPNGICKVRVSRAMPSIGQIDYEQEVAE